MAYRITVNRAGGTTVNVGASQTARTDAELESLKEEYRQKIAQAEAAQVAAEHAKAAYMALALELEDIAQETTSQEILDKFGDIDFTEILDKIDNIDIGKATEEDKGLIAAAILRQNPDAGVSKDSTWEELSDAIDNFDDVVAVDMTDTEIINVVDELSLNILGV